MQIKAYVKEGYVALECEGIFFEPVQKILLDRQTRLFKVIFEWSGDEISLDCPIDDEMFEAIGDHDQCGLGYYFKGDMLGASFVPFEQVN